MLKKWDAEEEIGQERGPEAKRRNLLRSIIRAGQVATALSAIGGLVGDVLRPLASINFLAFAATSVAAIVLLVLCMKRVRFFGYGLGVACFFTVCLALGFGAWWKLAESRGGGRGFLAEHLPIVHELQTAIMTERKVEGKRLIDGPAAGPAAQSHPAEGLDGALRGFPAKVIKAEVVGEPKVKKKSGSEIVLGYTLQIAVDLARYQAFADGLVAELGKVATAQGECLGKGFPTDRHFIDASTILTELAGSENSSIDQREFKINKILYIGDGSNDVGFDHDWWKGKLDKDEQMVVVVNTARSGLDDRTRWVWFHVPKSQGFRPGLVVDISFLDSQGTEMSRDRFAFRGRLAPALAARKRSISDVNWQVEEVIVSPYCLTESRAYWRVTDLPMEIRLTPDEVRRLATIRCTVKSPD